MDIWGSCALCNVMSQLAQPRDITPTKTDHPQSHLFLLWIPATHEVSLDKRILARQTRMILARTVLCCEAHMTL
jgi:hypothetical protein